jgi:hypothetical protein
MIVDDALLALHIVVTPHRPNYDGPPNRTV